MSTSGPAVRMAAFAAGLAVVFGAMFGIGRAVGPWDTDPGPSHSQMIEQHGEGQVH